jgi:hypothetical protein
MTSAAANGLASARPRAAFRKSRVGKQREALSLAGVLGFDGMGTNAELRAATHIAF